MKEKHTYKLQETLTYVLIWSVILVSPLLLEWLLARSGDNVSFEWYRVFHVWIILLSYCFLFCVHNCLLAPLLTRYHRRGYYFLCTTLLIVLFGFYQYKNKPHERPMMNGDPPPMEQVGEGPPADRPPLRRADQPKWRSPEDHRPPLLVGQHDMVAVTLLILIFAANLGVKYYFHHRIQEADLKELEHKNLEERLSFLRFQVNPHFLMNTLNNIHSLIDVDPERAQTAIVEFSRLLRYTLYDAEHAFVPFQKEVAFIQNYLELMRIRFSDEVDIQFNVSTPLPSGNIPPLIYACFLENAFKYGVSYQQPSFVHITFSEESAGRLHFSCINSLFPKSETNAISGGLGLRNVRQRLEIMFPNNHELVIQETESTYAIYLDIPLTT